MSAKLNSTGRSIWLTSATAAILVLATPVLGAGVAAEKRTANGEPLSAAIPVSDDIVQSFRLMFTGSYRYSPPGRVDQSEIRNRILPPPVTDPENLPVEKAAYIPNKLDFRIAPNALTVKPDARPSIAHVVPYDSIVTGESAASVIAREAATAALPPPPHLRNEHRRPRVRPAAPHQLADLETSEHGAAKNRSRSIALVVVDHDIALAADLALRLIARTQPKQISPTSGEPRAVPTEDPVNAQPDTRDLSLLDLPEELAPAAGGMATVTAEPMAAIEDSSNEIAALPSRNPRRNRAALAALRRNALRRARRAAWTKRKKKKKTTVVSGGLGDSGSAPQWARHAFGSN